MKQWNACTKFKKTLPFRQPNSSAYGFLNQITFIHAFSSFQCSRIFNILLHVPSLWLLLSPCFLTGRWHYINSCIRSRGTGSDEEVAIKPFFKFLFSPSHDPLWTSCKAAGPSTRVLSRILFFHWYVLYTFWTIRSWPHCMFINTRNYFPTGRFRVAG